MNKLLLTSGVVAMLATNIFAADGAILFKKCVACHGPKAEKSYLNKVAVINTFSKDDLVTSINGYKDGTINKYKMGAIMKANVKSLTDEEVNALAEYITTLK